MKELYLEKQCVSSRYNGTVHRIFTYRLTSDGHVYRTVDTSDAWIELTGKIDLDGKRKRVCVIILEHFGLPKPSMSGPYICCHKDDDSSNNDISNLYWGTYSNNTADAIRNKKHRAIRIDVDLDEVNDMRASGMSLTEISISLNISLTCLKSKLTKGGRT